MMCNSTQYEPIEYPTPLFEQTELNVCLENDQDHKTYLKHVALYAPVNCPYFLYGSEMEEEKFRELNPEFTLYWKERTERSWGGNECSAVAHFVKDAETGHYNIYEASYLDPHTQTDKFRPQKRQVPICRTIGQRAVDSRESVEACAKGRG